MVKKFLLSALISVALSTGLCGCGSNNGSGASFFRGTDGTGTGNTGFYGDYTYGAQDTNQNDTSTRRGSKNMTDTIDNSDTSNSSERQTTGLGNSGEAYFYDTDGNVMKTDSTGSIVGSDNFRTSTSQGFAFPEAPVNP